MVASPENHNGVAHTPPEQLPREIEAIGTLLPRRGHGRKMEVDEVAGDGMESRSSRACAVPVPRGELKDDRIHIGDKVTSRMLWSLRLPTDWLPLFQSQVRTDRCGRGVGIGREWISRQSQRNLCQQRAKAGEERARTM